MPTPPKPDRFHPEIPPPGFEKKLISFWQDRPIITPRMQLVHTNGASREGNIQSSFNWANQPGSGHTIPHCQIDRDGRGAMMLPSNRRGIANYKAAGFSIAFETADTGYLDDPSISAFTDKQAESVAVALAYYSWGHKIPLVYPSAWDGTGSACHTEPFAYPYWTNSNGKICPGLKKKAQMRSLILPRAREILGAWLAPPPVLEDDMLVNAATLASVKSAPSVAAVEAGDEATSRWLQQALVKALLFQVTGSTEYTQAAAEKLNAIVSQP
ncbi:MAG: N-acetylmuramoyl-L-alanine amidase [Gemmatimonadaceae bacterium]|nr:N-acetylmuramoyl-L-alanine amidase [Gemmatimonadaceae bacterium]